MPIVQTSFEAVLKPCDTTLLERALAPLVSPSLTAITAAFGDMELAEEVITDTLDEMELISTERQRVWEGVFIWLKRGPILADVGDNVYRAHCTELVRRYAAGGDMDAATNAEIATTLCRASLIAPLMHAPATVAIQALQKVERGTWEKGLEDWQMRGEWDGHLDEIRADVDKQVRKAWAAVGGRGPTKGQQ